MFKCIYFRWLSNLSWRGNKWIGIFYVGWKQVGFKVLLPLSDARAVHFSQVRLEKEEWSAFCGMDVIFSDVLRWRWGGGTGSTWKCSAFTTVLRGCRLRDTHAWDYGTSLASELVWNLFLPPSTEPVPLAAACLLLHPQLLALGGRGGCWGPPSPPGSGRGAGDARRAPGAGGKQCPAVPRRRFWGTSSCSSPSRPALGWAPNLAGWAWVSAGQARHGGGPFARSQGSWRSREGGEPRSTAAARGAACQHRGLLGRNSPAECLGVFVFFFLYCIAFLTISDNAFVCPSLGTLLSGTCKWMPLGLTRWKVKLRFPVACSHVWWRFSFFVWCRAVSAEKLANQKSHSVERKLKQHLRVWWRPMKNMGGSPRLSLMADVTNLHLTKMLNKSTVTSPQCCTPPILFYFSFSYIPWMSRRHLSYLWTDVFTEGEKKQNAV